jgi:diaminohydroxyphosphoribosylaminopyrimidine deaminase/5-amino-6-(5-phosphoribosylamino)uracil reductase
VYVTLEPCAHHGKTPPCTDALLAAGVSRVVVAVRDPHPVAAGGAEQLRGQGVIVDVGVCEAEGRELNAPFLHAVTSTRPWVTLKLATSVDGAIADHTRRPGWLTGPEARAEVHRLRAQHDAVGVGMGTVLADDPALTVRDVKAPRVPPVRVFFSRTGRLPVTSALAATARDVPVLVVAQEIDPAYEATLNEMGVDVITASSLGEALRALRGRGMHSIMIEGGARLAGALLFEGLVDRLVVFTAPVVLGAGALNAFLLAPAQRAEAAQRMRVVRRETFGDDLMTVYALDAARAREDG